MTAAATCSGGTTAPSGRALADDLAQVSGRITALDEALDELRSRRDVNDERRDVLRALSRVTDFAQLDWRTEVARVADVQAQLAELAGSSDVLADLQRQLERQRAQIVTLEGRRAPLLQRIGAIKDRIEQDLRALDELRAAPSPPLPEADAATLDQRITAAADERGLTLTTAEAIERRIRDDLQDQADKFDKRVSAAAERAIRAMAGFRGSWPLLTAEMDAAIEAGPEYRDLLHRLVADDLPRFEAEFKEQLNVNAIREVVGFSSALAAAHGEIARRVAHINDSLSDIDYQAGTYIHLEVAPTTDADVREFRNDLRACTEGAVLGSGDDQYSEAKFLEVKRIVGRLAGRPGARRRTSAGGSGSPTCAPGRPSPPPSAAGPTGRSSSTSPTRRASPAGRRRSWPTPSWPRAWPTSSGSIRGETHTRTFRFVVIDEAFGRGSDESARFALELFARLDLQLLVVTPLQKIHIIEPYVTSVGFVHNEGGHTSKLRNLSIETYRAERALRAEQRAAAQVP